MKAREGRTRKIAYPRVIPHSDGAGEIDMVGEGVARSRIGERVWTWNAQWKRAFGTCADYVVLPAALAAPLPAQVSFEAGACLGIPAMTAYHAVAVAGASKGMTVLISGGAGGVGHYAIQFAKASGANVITTVSSEAKARLAQAAGADHVIDYKHENVAERVSAITAKKGVDAVIEMDLAANAKLYPGILRARGSVVVYGTGSAEAQIPAQFLLVNAIADQVRLCLRAHRRGARCRGQRHQPHARGQDAHQQCRAHLAADRYRRRPRGGGAGQGAGQRRGADRGRMMVAAALALRHWFACHRSSDSPPTGAASAW